MKNLTELLTKYKELTVKIYDKVNKDEYDEEIDTFFDKRKIIIEEIKDKNYTGEELRTTVKTLKVLEEEKKLEDVLSLKKSEVQKAMAKLRVGKNARNTYGKGFSVGSFYMSKKI
ncbi:flagellar protein FliT [Clostridium felsineum]|uniref:flagellar protein FliT n=1 Tax=Clostridium felsineum TaxID=36839 RepID=UPI00098C92E9|nr:flagellar protein FliT [Clostridium felsineum]URZ00976.1 hypothetical protein CLAUR_009640 [Clostridium felsineum]